MDTFEEYERFIYLNTNMSEKAAREFSRQCWNDGLNKYQALEKANGEHE